VTYSMQLGMVGYMHSFARHRWTSPALDAVNHIILCRRIESNFGVTGTALSWLRSFVSDRSQYVAVGSVKSETACDLISKPMAT